MSVLSKKSKLVGRVVDALKAEASATDSIHWSVSEQLEQFRKSLTDDPGAEYEAMLKDHHPLHMPDDFIPEEFGITAESTVQDYQNAYERILKEGGKSRNLRMALKRLESIL